MLNVWIICAYASLNEWVRVQEYKQAPLRAYRHTASSKIPTLSNKLRQLRVWLEHKRSLQKLFFCVKRNFIDYSWKCYNQEQSMARYKQDNSLATQHCGSDASPFVQDHQLLNFSLYMIQLKTWQSTSRMRSLLNDGDMLTCRLQYLHLLQILDSRRAVWFHDDWLLEPFTSQANVIFTCQSFHLLSIQSVEYCLRCVSLTLARRSRMTTPILASTDASEIEPSTLILSHRAYNSMLMVVIAR